MIFFILYLNGGVKKAGGLAMFDFDPDEHIKKQRENDDIFKSLKRKNFHKIGNRLDGK